MEQQRHGKKNCRLAGEPLPLRSTPFHLFFFLSARSLEALFRQRGSDRTFHGDSIRGAERRRTKVLTRLPRSMNKTWPSFFSEGLCLSQHSEGQNLFFLHPGLRYFPVSLSKIVFFFFSLVHSAPAAPV